MILEFSTEGSHSLRRFLESLVWRHLFEDVGLEEPPVAQYVTHLLTDFTFVDNLFRIQNTAGKKLNDVGEMLIESNPLSAANSFDRERQVRKHVGDYTLFMAGLFPEHVARLRYSTTTGLEAYVDFVGAGKESYAIVAAFDQFEYRAEAPLFDRLSKNFELCVAGLQLVKRDVGDFSQELTHTH